MAKLDIINLKGEKVEDLEPFDIEKYIYGLFKDL